MRLLSARLSAKRRSPLAGAVVLMFGLLMTGGVYAVVSPAQAESTSSASADVDAGRKLFLVGCSSCHGLNAEGVVTSRGTQYGPSLIGVGAAAVDFQMDTGRMPMATVGAQAPRKRVVYSEDQIAQIAAYIQSLGPGPNVPSPEQYDPATIPEDELGEAIVRGREIFFTNCTACHNFAGKGGALSRGKYAPSLTGVTDEHIWEALITGPQQMPVFSDENISAEDKLALIAYLNNVEEEINYGGFGLGALGPVSEGMFAWLVGIGGCTAFAIWIAAHSTRSTKKKGKSA